MVHLDNLKSKVASYENALLLFMKMAEQNALL